MANAKLKTTENSASVPAFIKKATTGQQQKDALALIDMMKRQSGLPPKMWGPAIIGFGKCHYKYESGREGDMPIVAFSPRKATLTLYLSTRFEKRDELLKKLGKHTTSVACLYIKKLEDVDVKVLEKMIGNSFKYTNSKNK